MFIPRQWVLKDGGEWQALRAYLGGADAPEVAAARDAAALAAVGPLELRAAAARFFNRFLTAGVRCTVVAAGRGGRAAARLRQRIALLLALPAELVVVKPLREMVKEHCA